MKTVKMLGIWMDHASANVIEFIKSPVGAGSIELGFINEEKENSLSKSEHIMHNKEQQHQTAYYKSIGDVIQNYEHVILFGPTDAKVELLNILKKDHHFDKIKITTQSTDKMTENQQQAFVADYFSRN